MRMSLIPWSIAGVPSSQALLGFSITVHHLCIPAVIGALAVWRQNKTKQKKIWGGFVDEKQYRKTQ